MPGGTAPRAQVTVPAGTVQVPWVVVTVTSVSAGARGSLRVTPAVVAGPKLTTVSV